ncbi:MAG TPA: SUMF1/EgtB/PvdO family nonheme iron enzyme [Armatimonadota bacterium]|nr:SUMF1/EgtB/PvdO family nonheme iron enzyme [Armatimonadota bacterium]
MGRAMVLLGLPGLLVGAANGQLARPGLPDGWTVSPENEARAGEAGYRILHDDTGIELLFMPAGAFVMGATETDPDAVVCEKPEHDVQLGACWIGRTEVTVGQWRGVMGGAPDGNSLGDDYPLVNVPWQQANLFCIRLGLRLPTEAEWEQAARGPERPLYPWGDEWLDGRCCFGGDAPCAPGQHAEGASWLGAVDMAGNVSEWCADWYADGYYETSSRSNPEGPRIGTERVTRGGSWCSESQRDLRGSARDSRDPTSGAADLGFRVARDGA